MRTYDDEPLLAASVGYENRSDDIGLFMYDVVCGGEPPAPWLHASQIFYPGVILDVADGEPVDHDERGWTTTDLEGSLPAGSTFEAVMVLRVPLDEETGEPVCAPDEPAWLFIDDAWALGSAYWPIAGDAGSATDTIIG